MGPESTIPYYHDIVYGVQEAMGKSIFPELSIDSVNVFNVLKLCDEKKYDELTEYLMRAINNLVKSGAEFAALSANTPHIVFDRLKEQSPIDAIQFYIDNYGKETFVIKKKEKERAEYIRSEDIDDIKEEVIEAATNEARKEVIRLLGGVISGMNVGQPVIMQAANSEAQEPTEDVMDDADVAGLAMGWMSKGD
mgnify:CR=1 FL=1